MAATALILAGHGSHISPNTAGLVWRYVDRLRQFGIADEVTACFWKEPSSFHHVLDSVVASDVTIVPMFTARGYFSGTVIPTEMGLIGHLTMRSHQTIRYARTLGEHPYLAQIVRQRVMDVITTARLNMHDVAVAVIGHGTKRDPASRDTTRAQANALRDSKLVAEVVDVYLDDDPAIPDAYQMTKSPILIAVPFFLAPGSHTTSDVPTALGLRPGDTHGTIEGRNVYYTPAVGTDETICELILELARDTGMPFQPHPAGSAWNAFPAAGRTELIQAVQEHETLQFGQLLLSPTSVKPVGAPEPAKIMDTPFALRQYLREQPFRPLPTSTDLPSGWCVSVEYPEMLHAVVETVYPGAVADWSAHQRGTFVASTLQDTIARQTGMYRTLKKLTPAQSAQVVENVCGRCVRHPTWHHGASPAGLIPCPEPCSFWMSRAQEYLS